MRRYAPRFLALLLALTLLFSAAACGGGKTLLDDQAFANPDPQYGMLKIAHNFSNMYGENVCVPFFDTLRNSGYDGLVTNVSFSGYLTSDRSWQMFSEQLQWAADHDVRIWIYDEHGYPSGGAERLVLTDNPEFEALGLTQVRQTVRGGETLTLPLPAVHNRPFYAVAYPDAAGGPALDQAVDLTDAVGADGTLEWEAPAGGDWVVETYSTKPLYEDTHAEGNAHQDRRYINIMDADAVAKFIKVTYDAYYERAGDLFGSTIEAFFTDEPSIISFYVGDFGTNIPVIDQPDPDFVRYPMVGWLDGFLEQFSARKGYDLAPLLPYLFGGEGEAAARVRYDYWEVAAALIEESYYQQIGDWCAAHGVLLSGHMLAEEALNTQVLCEGNFFDNLKHFTYPGIDMLTSAPEGVVSQYLTPKLVSSAARLYDRPGVMSESSCHSNKDTAGRLTVSLDEIRCALAAQYALGVTQITSYYSYSDLEPEDVKTDEIDRRQQTGKMVSRLGYALDGGTHVSDVVVYYPYETMYAELLPTTENWNEPRSEKVGKTCDVFHSTVKLLLDSQIDNDVLPDEAFLNGSAEDGLFVSPGGERFRVIVVPSVSMLSTAVIDQLTAYADAGVGLVFLPDNGPLCTPTGEDTAAAQAKWSALRGHANARTVESVADAVKAARAFIGTADLRLADGGSPAAEVGGPSIVYTHQQREDGDVYLLVNYTGAAFDGQATFRAQGSVRRLDPLTGSIESVKGVQNEDGTTTVELHLDGYGYLLFELA